MTPFVRLHPVSSPDVPAPSDKRVPRGWGTFTLTPDGAPVHLVYCGATVALPAITRLRLAVGLDEREEKRVEVILPQSGWVIGEFDLRYYAIFQVAEITLSGVDGQAILHEGVGLRLVKGEQPLWVLTDHAEADGSAAGLMPHLMAQPHAAPDVELLDRMTSLASLQAWGWLEGCVLEGLWDLAIQLKMDPARAAIDAHLAQFLDAGGLVYEDPRSRPADGRIYGIEGTLPFAVLARVQPAHPTLAQVIKFWTSHRRPDGAIQDGGTLSAEGNYTVAYPLAVVAQRLGRPDLANLAIEQLRVRRDRLWQDRTFGLRTHDDGRQTFQMWTRGVAWYLLGLVRTLIALGDRADVADLRAECTRAATWAMQYQQADGLWACFVDEPHVLPDTSGSAGVAAALALGARHGLLPGRALEAAERTKASILPYLTPDGFLTGVAQMNRGGEELQRSDYRVMSQMGMGLLAQLIAALRAQGG